MIRVGGFFTGIGAHHSALKRISGEEFEVVFQCEIDPKTARAYNTMHGDTKNLGDITKVENLDGDLSVDILFWTPPCQDIAICNGKREGNAKGSGTRSALAHEVPRILSNTSMECRPRYLILEEVPTMVSQRYIGNFTELLDALSLLGYFHEWGVLNATDYGVPQSRRRLYCISKLGSPAPSLPSPRPLCTCMADYLEPEPVDSCYYISEDRVAGMIRSSNKEGARGNGFRFKPTDGGGHSSHHLDQGRGKENGQLPHCGGF